MGQEMNFFDGYELKGEYEIKGKTYKQDKLSMRQELDLIKAAHKRDVDWSDLQEKLKEMGFLGLIDWLDEQDMVDVFLQIILQDDTIKMEDIDASVGHDVLKDFFLLNPKVVNDVVIFIFKSLSYSIQMRKKMAELKKNRERKSSKK